MSQANVRALDGTVPSTSPSSAPAYTPARNMTRKLAILGFISAVLSLLIVPEIFGSVAIILGAYIWRRERDDSQNLGLTIVILGIICMLVGLYFTSYFELEISSHSSFLAHSLPRHRFARAMIGTWLYSQEYNRRVSIRKDTSKTAFIRRCLFETYMNIGLGETVILREHQILLGETSWGNLLRVSC